MKTKVMRYNIIAHAKNTRGRGQVLGMWLDCHETAGSHTLSNLDSGCIRRGRRISEDLVFVHDVDVKGEPTIEVI